jgi:molecular chaperone DnaK (HSP70)
MAPHPEILISGGILAVVLSAIFAAVYNPLPPKPGVVGIDLGTTYSVIALFHNGSVEVVPDSEQKNLTPSVVAFTPSGVLVGYAARKYGVMHPEAVVFDAKRLIGHKYGEETVQHDQALYPFGVVDVNGYAHSKHRLPTRMDV